MRAFHRNGADMSCPEYLDRLRFPAHPWSIVETRFDPADLGTTESIFALGNGYLGLRGNVEEGHDAHAHGTFINGFHETWPIRHAEEAYGFARTGQTMANVPDPKTMRLYIDDEPLRLATADLEHYVRILDMQTGLLTRDLVWRTPAGNRVKVTSTRLVSFTHRHIALLTFDVTLLDKAAPVALSSHVLNRAGGIDEYRAHPRPTSAFDPRRAEQRDERVLIPRMRDSDGRRAVMGFECANSGMTIAVATEHAVASEADVLETVEVHDDYAKHTFEATLEPGQTLSVSKLVAFHTSSSVPPRELADRCHRTLNRAVAEGTDLLLQEQREWLDDFWARSDVEVDGNDGLQQAIRFNLFHLAQAGARADGAGIPAKGVTGSGYGGHYFWDTEIYVVPFFIYTAPETARNALRFRYKMLPAARQRAAELAQHGALYPWRTINGEEASAYYAAGTAQYHIDADVSYAIDKYVRATGDDDFMAREGIDILVETARMWADLGFWRQVKGEAPSFHIHGVTGPDEYTTVVNENLYTNVMARFNLRAAARAARHLEQMWPDEHARMVARLSLEPAELDEWERAAEAMTILWDDALGIHPQDELFNEREVWDLANTPPDKRPLLLHFHPLVIYRFQVLKQADVVLALFLQCDEFTAAEKKADFDYYDPITTGDSTLSGAVQSIIAAEVGYHELALRYFWDGAFMDLADLHGNTSDGIHVACAGGVWASLINGFAGMRDQGEFLRFDPRLPASWRALTFRVTHRGTRVRVRLTSDEMSFAVEEGTGLSVLVRDERLSVTQGADVVVPLAHQGARIAGGPTAEDIRGAVREDGSIITASLPANVAGADTGVIAMISEPSS